MCFLFKKKREYNSKDSFENYVNVTGYVGKEPIFPIFCYDKVIIEYTIYYNILALLNTEMDISDQDDFLYIDIEGNMFTGYFNKKNRHVLYDLKKIINSVDFKKIIEECIEDCNYNLKIKGETIHDMFNELILFDKNTIDNPEMRFKEIY